MMRLDWDDALLPSSRKRAGMAGDALHNHHTKGIEERRKKIVAAMRPGACGDLLPTALWNGTRGHKWRRLELVLSEPALSLGSKTSHFTLHFVRP